MNDTICAISTSVANGAINIIRISGNDTFAIVNKISNIDIKKYEANTINYAHIMENKEIIDEVLISKFNSPKSFTSEDTIEINCHGGIAVTNKILELLLLNGCRLADKGEFTKRAFLNGKIDLIQAEAIMDMINAKTEAARKLSINSITKKTSEKIDKVRNKVLDIIANIEVNIDYPEYDDITNMDTKLVKEKLTEILKELMELLRKSNNSKIITNGLNLGIIGKPNVGKSSILNLLLEEDKAIVTNISGTTTDTVEGQITIDSNLVNLIDTAGIRNSENKIEQLGIEKSKKIIDTSDLVILVFNNNEELDEVDLNLLKLTNSKERIILINKSDLEQKINYNLINDEFVTINTIDTNNSDIVKGIIADKFKTSDVTEKDYTYLTSARSISLLKKSIDEIESALNHNDIEYVDILLIYIKNAWDCLSDITGNSYDEELLDNLFSNYCLGK